MACRGAGGDRCGRPPLFFRPINIAVWSKDRRGDDIAELERHRSPVAARLAKRGGCDLDEPEPEDSFGNIAQDLLGRTAVLGF